MREVTVRDGRVSVSDDPHRVLTQLLSCLLEETAPRQLESGFAPGGSGFSIDNVVEARPITESGTPFRVAPNAIAEPWIVKMYCAKREPCEVVLDGEQLRRLVHAALFPAQSVVAARNREQMFVAFGGGGLVFVAVTLLGLHAAGWMAVPTGLMMGIVVAYRLSIRFR